MPVYQPFSYSECLPIRSVNALPIELRIRPGQIEEVLLLRLLTGTLDITSTANAHITRARVNYGLLDSAVNRNISARTVLEPFTSERIPTAKVIGYYQNCLTYGNRRLWKRFFLELCNYAIQKNKGSNALAFIHAYRSLELISYCFPLVFAARSTSYERTYLDLKKFFKESDKELSFFINFVNNHLFSDNLILDQHLPITISEPIVDLREQYFNLMKKRCEGNSGIPIISATPFSEIVITRRGLLKLAIDIRNRYFHLLTGDYNANLGSDELCEPDRFFALVCDKVVNWLGVTYFEILRTYVDP